MRVSDDLIDFICRSEGMRLSTYRDSGGVATIGCGHTGKATGEGTITEGRARSLARADLASAAACIERQITRPITQGMFDALVSMAYNMGCTGLGRTGIPDLVNAGDYNGAARRIPKVGLTDRQGNTLDGLRKRRQDEQAMFLSGGKSPATPSPRLWIQQTTPTSWLVLPIAATCLGTILFLTHRRSTSHGRQ